MVFLVYSTVLLDRGMFLNYLFSKDKCRIIYVKRVPNAHVLTIVTLISANLYRLLQEILQFDHIV